MATIEHVIDQVRQRVLIRFVGEVDGRHLHAAMQRLWQECPTIASCDSICDMGEFTGDIGFDDIRTISDAWRLFCGGHDRDRRTAVVTRDRYAPLYIKAIKLCFTGRDLAVFRSLPEAERWLDRLD